MVKRVILVALGLGAAALAGEWALRRFDPAGDFIYRLDDELLHDALPSAHTVQRMPKATLGAGDVARVEIETGDEGFRGRSLASPKTGPRVLVIGDSYVMAENVPLDATFVERLGVELRAELGNDAIEVVNAGRSGYGPGQALLLLERVIDDVQPDLVVCVLNAHNDFGDLMRNKLFRVGDDGGSLQRASPRIGARMQDWFAASAESASGSALVRLFERATRGSNGADLPEGVDPIPMYLTALRAQFEEHWLHRNDEVVSIFEDIYDADIATGVDREATAAKAKLMSLIAARMMAATGETPLRFVVVPSAVDICRNFRIKVDVRRFSNYDSDRLIETLTGSLDSAEVQWFDVTPALRNPGSPMDENFVGGTDPHWNALGQSRAAKGVAGWIVGAGEASDALTQRPAGTDRR